jgi:predicted permease
MRQLLRRVWYVIRQRRRQADLAEEMEFHHEMMQRELRERGVDSSEARLGARRALGSAALAADQSRDVWIWPWLDGVRQDVTYALRQMRRQPGFTTVAVTILALGIGINATVFTVTNAALFKGFPFVDANDRILYLERHGAGFSYPDFENWRAQAKSLEGMAAATAWLITFSDSGKFPEVYAATVISANGFKLIGQRPILGRDFAPSDETPGAAPVAILSYRLWERRYGKDPAILGQTVRIEIWRSDVLQHDTATVIGVMAQGVAFPFSQDLWVPLVPPRNLQTREARNITFFFGRMVEGVTTKTARAEMETIGRRLASAYPVTNSSISVQDFNQHFIGPRATMIFESMLGAVGFVLSIACANLANLMLARAIGRSREMSVRTALGAGRWRIIRQLLIESVMLSATGGVFGWWIATWGVRAYALAGFAPFQYPHDLDLTMDDRVLGYLIAISIGTGLLFGLAPASRLSKLDVNGALKDVGRGATGGGRGKHLSALLVIGQMALAVVLLAGAGVMIRSFLKIYTADMGIRTTNVLAAAVGLPVVKYPSAEAQISFYDRLKTRLEAIPGVESIAIADRFPTQGARRLPYELAGASPVDERPCSPAVNSLTPMACQAFRWFW